MSCESAKSESADWFRELRRVQNVHIITKIFVVFAAILSVLLAALSVAYSTNADRIVAGYKDIESRASAANAMAAEANTKVAAAVSDKQAELDALESQLRERDDDLTDFERDNQRLLADAKLAEAAQVSVMSKIDQLGATVSTQATIIKSLQDEVKERRTEGLRFIQREIELTDRISDLSGQLEVAIETNRALLEQLEELRDTYGGSGGPFAGDRGNQRGATLVVRARITEVRRDPGSGNLLAAIDAGSNDRIREGMELTISRRGSFIGKLVVDSVSLNTAVGSVDTLNRDVTVQPGDLVTVVTR